jgi:general L-amino acid transport system substrate-binding protein
MADHLIVSCKKGTQMNKSTLAMAALAISTALTGAAVAQDRSSPKIDEIKARGVLNCPGHNGSNPGFMEVDDQGNWNGLDIDICRAIATAILGDPSAVNIVPMSFAQRWTSLEANEIDLVIKTTDGTMTRDTDLGLQFSTPYLYGAFQFIAHAGPTSAAELEGGTICTSGGTSNIRYLTEYLALHNIDAEVLTFEKREEEYAAYGQGRCDADMGWGPNLAILRADQDNPDDHVILPEVLTVGPQVILVEENDDRFLDVINWTLQTLFIAEENGVTSANLDEMKANPPSPVVERLLGVAPGIGTRLGLEDDFAYNIIKAVGNYGELYNRTFGEDSAYFLPRGMNALWRDGGVIVPLLLD